MSIKNWLSLALIICFSAVGFAQVISNDVSLVTEANVLNQGGGENGRSNNITVQQVGNDNKMDVFQLQGFPQSANRLDVKQNGDANQTVIGQGGDNNKAQIIQEGNNQRVKVVSLNNKGKIQIAQRGVGNTVIQKISGNGAKQSQVIQDGIGNKVKIEMSEKTSLKSPIRVLQKGKAPAVLIFSKHQ